MKNEIKNLGKSFKNAFCGIIAVMRHERNFRVHICMMLYVIFFSVIGEVEKLHFSRFVLCFGIVMFAELINTAIELLCNAVTEKYDERIREIKDIAAGAVLVSTISAATVGLMVFLNPGVFGTVMAKFTAYPLLAAAFLISVPFAVIFILKRGKK